MLKKSKKAIEIYEKTRSRNAVSGFIKYVLTNGEQAIFISEDDAKKMDINSDEMIFKLSTINTQTKCEFFRKA